MWSLRPTYVRTVKTKWTDCLQVRKVRSVLDDYIYTFIIRIMTAETSALTEKTMTMVGPAKNHHRQRAIRRGKHRNEEESMNDGRHLNK